MVRTLFIGCVCPAEGEAHGRVGLACTGDAKSWNRASHRKSVSALCTVHYGEARWFERRSAGSPGGQGQKSATCVDEISTALRADDEMQIARLVRRSGWRQPHWRGQRNP